MSSVLVFSVCIWRRPVAFPMTIAALLILLFFISSMLDSSMSKAPLQKNTYKNVITWYSVVKLPDVTDNNHTLTMLLRVPHLGVMNGVH